MAGQMAPFHGPVSGVAASGAAAGVRAENQHTSAVFEGGFLEKANAQFPPSRRGRVHC